MQMPMLDSGEPDYLLYDVRRSEKAGMSYGKFVYLHGCTSRREHAEPEPEGIRKICRVCGKEFFVQSDHRQKYCCQLCKDEADRMKNREYNHRRKKNDKN